MKKLPELEMRNSADRWSCCCLEGVLDDGLNDAIWINFISVFVVH